MSKKIKYVIISFIVLLIVCPILYISIYNAMPDYIKCDEALKGYTDCTGYDHTGKDADIYYVYSYGEEHIQEFAENDLYTRVDDSNIDEVKEMIKWYEQYDGNERFSDTVSNGDYFILKYLDNDGNEIENFDNYYMLYFFDVQSQKLYYLLQSM